MGVYILWHVHHVAQDVEGNVIHFDGEECSANEEEGDDVKLLGVYSALERVEQRILTAKELPGFRDEPECFWYAEFELDEDMWTEGFGPI
ncbi:hypothetical protein [Sphaerisporangium perillae]|uniref:hypothetical protein n=1 Tax=Sphaerisporangium perillae TaxID=2935860 RepID=UPI00200DC575|nr:hypothetical protein [Sphaerisporangium perillae]